MVKTQRSVVGIKNGNNTSSASNNPKGCLNITNKALCDHVINVQSATSL